MAKTESLFLGIIAALGALVVIVSAMVLMQIFAMEKNGLDFQAYLYAPSFIAFAVLIEELSKYTIIKKRIATAREKSSAIINASFFGLGFASIEAIFILMGNFSEKSAYPHILEISMIHIFTAIVIAYVMTKDRLPAKSALALLPAVGVHLAYNFAVSSNMAQQASLLSGSLFVAISIALTWSIWKKNRLA